MQPPVNIRNLINTTGTVGLNEHGLMVKEPIVQPGQNPFLQSNTGQNTMANLLTGR